MLSRLAAGLLALFWAVVFYGAIDLLAFLQGPGYHDALMLSTGWGVLFVFLVATPLAVLCVTPRAAGAAIGQVLLVGLALAVAAGLSTYPRALFVAAGVIATGAILAGLAAPSPPGWVSSWRWSSAPMAVVALAAGPLCTYAWTSAGNTDAATLHSESVGLDHWPVQAALPIATLLIAVFAAGHPRGWRMPLWSAAVASAWFAIVALTEPHLVGSVSRTWSAALLAWSVVLVLVTHRSRSARR